jgi:hypothetical protein
MEELCNSYVDKSHLSNISAKELANTYFGDNKCGPKAEK